MFLSPIWCPDGGADELAKAMALSLGTDGGADDLAKAMALSLGTSLKRVAVVPAR